MMAKISSRQLQIYETLNAFLSTGWPPTTRELMRACGLSSASVIDYHIRCLWGLGLVTKKQHIARSMRLVREFDIAPLAQVPQPGRKVKPKPKARPRVEMKLNGIKLDGNVHGIPPQHVIERWRKWGWAPERMGAVAERLRVGDGT